MRTLAISIEKAVIARLHIKGNKFEILVDPKLAWEFKQGKDVEIDEILAYPAIYRDVRAAEVASEEELQSNFGTTDYREVAKKIIKEGELQLTVEQRREMIEQKKNQIASIIAKQAINPQTNTPHPPSRIINAMEQLGINIDPFIEAELQVERILPELKKLLPLKFQKVIMEVKIPPAYVGKIFASPLKKYANIKEESWESDGSLKLKLEFFAGSQQEIEKVIANATHGNFESKILERVDV